MTDFEDLLRRDLHDAAEAAPTFDPAPFESVERATSPTPPRRRTARWITAAAALAVVAAGLGGLAWFRSNTNGGGGSPEAQCASVMRFDGNRYNGAGVKRMPQPGRDLGTGRMPSCQDEPDQPADPGWSAEVAAIPGIRPEVAVLTDDGIWVAEDIGDWPRALTELQRPVKCEPGMTELTGTWISSGGKPIEDGVTPPPYPIGLMVEDGVGPQMESYSYVQIRAKITDRTTEISKDLVRAALWNAEPVTVHVHCQRDAFIVDSMQLA